MKIRRRSLAKRRIYRGLLLVSLIATASAVSRAQVLFNEVGFSRGIGTYPAAIGKISGVAAADFDDDGDIDLFVPTAFGRRDQLYENRNGQFFDIAAAAGVDSTANHRSPLFFDYDNDGNLDLFVAGDCNGSVCQEASLILYRQTSSRVFVDRTLESSIFILDFSEHVPVLEPSDRDSVSDETGRAGKEIYLSTE